MDPANFEKREFVRYNCNKPLNFKTLLTPKNKSTMKLVNGFSKDLSASGILFKSDQLPEISSILELNMDYRTTGICHEIEENALTVGDRLIGKVVRIEECEDGKYNIGVAFIKKTDPLAIEIQKRFK